MAGMAGSGQTRAKILEAVATGEPRLKGAEEWRVFTGAV